MGYSSRHGRRPAENASKSSHTYVISDSVVSEFLEQCSLPKSAGEVDLSKHGLIKFEPVSSSKVEHIIAIDGGYTEVEVKKEFPSAKIAFFQFGALFFSTKDLETMNSGPFIDPDDMSKLKNIHRLKLVLPIKNISLKDQTTLTQSVRKAVYDFFCQDFEGSSLMHALKWLILEEYQSTDLTWNLASCPHCRFRDIALNKKVIANDFTSACPECGGKIYLTDVLRLHEAIDDELGAGGILGYVTTSVEQLILVFLLKSIVELKPSMLAEILFIKDGPLAFFGQTANLYKPMRKLCQWLFTKHDLLLAGLEKSGSFVEHAHEIAQKLDNGSALLLDNEYIYKYIIPGKADPNTPYGSTTYYSNKVIFKTDQGSMYVISMPTAESKAHVTVKDFKNFDEILTNIQKLKCDMYDNSLMPVALANKLVSLSDHPSAKILQKFSISKIKQAS